MATDRKTNGMRLREARKLSGLKINEAADLLGISRNTLASYEADKTTPKITTLLKMAKIYKTNVYDIYKVMSGGSGESSPAALYEKAKAHARVMVESEMENDSKFSGIGPNKYYEEKYKALVENIINSPMFENKLTEIRELIEQDTETFF